MAFATSLQLMDLPSKCRVRRQSVVVNLKGLGSLVAYHGTAVGHVREAPRPRETSNDAVFLTWSEMALTKDVSHACMNGVLRVFEGQKKKRRAFSGECWGLLLRCFDAAYT